ncbi:helix-turn-helix domain-containing protein [Alicyclobacillus dauci]|uniref:Helix-turn-helix domain-containing protein n=1 Tax=Alicyclobacillus dauci TaxID=1475485 RepID=A0ABY6Z460_9BACL|nr:helix-turn-helix transcriptional regulator [Alicyclobacillus dauci]WAH37669.1 helix-turn-helix domain-containing protein [Alicyclobacillus dauci]
MTEAEREFLSLVIGHRVREQRKTRNLSQAELATGVGSQSMISLIESGRQLPLPDVLRVIAVRLEDEVLKSYAESLENNTIADFNVTSHNEEDLKSILVNHRGRWQPAHERIASQLCHHYYYTRHFEQVDELCHLIIHHVHRPGPKAEAYFYLGSSLLYQNRYSEAERWLKQAETLADLLSDQMKGKLNYNLGYAYSYLDIQVLAVWYASQAVDIFHRMNDFVSQGTALALLGAIQTRLGRLEEAKQTLTTSYDIVHRWGFKVADESRVHITLAEVCSLLGDVEEAKHNISLAIDSVDELDYLCKAEISRIKVYLAMKQGNLSEARENVKPGIRAALEAHDVHTLAQLYLLHVKLLDDVDEKIAEAKKAFDLTEGQNHHILRALSAECMANILEQRDGFTEESRIYMQAALDAYRTYVHKNSMFTNLIDNVPVYDSYFVENDVNPVESL